MIFMPTNTQIKALNDYFIECITEEPFKEETHLNTKICWIYQQFEEEKSGEIKRKGNKKACLVDWLQGMPSYLAIEHGHCEIVKELRRMNISMPEHRVHDWFKIMAQTFDNLHNEAMKMRSVKVLFENEQDNYSTNINGSNTHIIKYFVNQPVNRSYMGYDRVNDCEIEVERFPTCIGVEFLK